MYRKLNFPLLFLCVWLISFTANSQTKELRTFKYGKVAPEEFNTTVKGPDSAAAAIKLFDVGKGYFEINQSSGSFIYVFNRHVRYKVVNKNGYGLANLEIALYNNNEGSKEEITTIKGSTYNLSNGNIEISKMSSDAKFSNRLDKKHIVKKFTLPNVKEGSIIEYSYQTKSDFIYKLDDWYFQGEYPSKYSAFTLVLPEYYRYKIAIGGYLNIEMPKVESVMENYVVPSTNTSTTQNVSATATKNQYFVVDIPAIKTEKYITTLEDYVSKIGFELTSTSFPGSGYKDYSSTWPLIVESIMKEEKFGGFIRRDNYAKGFINGIIKDEKDSLKKMNLVFNYIKNNIKWDENYRLFTDATNQRAVLEKKSGSSAEINLCLLGMLKAAEIPAWPILISTRRNGTHPGYPLATKFNNVIIEAEIGGKKILLDATDKNNIANLISYQNLNHKGLKIDPGATISEWIPLEYSPVSRTSTTYSVKLGLDNKITGNLYLSSNNYEAVERRNSYKSATNEAEFLKTYKTRKSGLDITSYKITNLDLPEESLEETMDIVVDDNVEDAGNLVYFMPMLFERTKENPFSLEERNFPVDFAYPFEENYKMFIEFPDSYTLDKLPKSQAFKLPDEDGSFSIIYTTEGNKISVKSKISILKPVFTADEYFSLKELYKNIVKKQAEQIVFKKS